MTPTYGEKERRFRERLKGEIGAKEQELAQDSPATTTTRAERDRAIDTLVAENNKLLLRIKRAKREFVKLGYGITTNTNTNTSTSTNVAAVPVVDPLLPRLQREEDERILWAEVGDVLSTVVDRAIQRALLKRRPE
eukprot:gnl/Chilomastix_caulleri/2502.p2 GENE.gnl/Chilomastix_caulleri/2502~~gnl/Chilomastix_caulleri/2502.p2  ORF type:complete len:136 (+),score=46.77 gnl/Chilomastix_caulleri/2502:244-651(+)